MNKFAVCKTLPRSLAALCTIFALSAHAESFDRVYEEVIAPNCGPCHTRRAAGGLAMPDADTAFDNLLGATPACNGQPRVSPGDPEGSVLYRKLAGLDTCGNPMPPNGPLPADLIEAVRSWIAAGAAR